LIEERETPYLWKVGKKGKKVEMGSEYDDST
jgi:hypothetical protein